MKTTIVSMRRDRRGFKDEDGNWYSCFNASTLNGCERGDEVEFEFTEKGGYKNVQEKTFVKVGGSASAGDSAPTSRWHAYEDKEWQREINQRISKQNALNNAVALVSRYDTVHGHDEEYKDTLRRILATAETFLTWANDGGVSDEDS